MQRCRGIALLRRFFFCTFVLVKQSKLSKEREMQRCGGGGSVCVRICTFVLAKQSNLSKERETQRCDCGAGGGERVSICTFVLVKQAN
jgi:hypothetical protein